MQFDPMFMEMAVKRLLLAAVLGAVIGIERERKRKAAGLRTLTLITFGSALFTVLSFVLASKNGGDPQRIAAQLIPGIGFLGAGAIIQARGTVTGLTTAASIFVAASIGMAAGGGMAGIAIFCTALVLVFLIPTEALERRFELKMQTIGFVFDTRLPESCVVNVQDVVRREDYLIRDLRVRHSDNHCVVEFNLEVPQEKAAEAIRQLHEIRKLHA